MTNVILAMPGIGQDVDSEFDHGGWLHGHLKMV